jgi:YfiH family protein
MPTETITDEILSAAGFRWRTQDGVTILFCAPMEDAGFASAFSTRRGGVSPLPQAALNLAGFNDDAAENILENRRRFLHVIGGEWTLATCWQVHGAEVRRIDDSLEVAKENHRCDALMTATPGILLGVKTADCVPVLLADERVGAVAAVHAGWRGTLKRIVARAFWSLRQTYGTRAQDLRVSIGPAARACCYEVGPDVLAAFRQEFGEIEHLLTPTRPDFARIDLQRANAEQLMAEGVLPEKIHIAPLCTMCRTDLFFSYRREKAIHGRVGRSMAVIGRRKDR